MDLWCKQKQVSREYTWMCMGAINDHSNCLSRHLVHHPMSWIELANNKASSSGTMQFIHQKTCRNNCGKYRMYLNTSSNIRMMAWMKGSTPSLPLTVNGVSVNALLDAGLAVSTISLDTLKQLGTDGYVNSIVDCKRGDTLKIVGWVTIHFGTLGQQLMVAAHVFQENPANYNIILGWPEFHVLCGNDHYRTLPMGRYWTHFQSQNQIIQAIMPPSYMDTASRTMVGNVPTLDLKSVH